MHVQIACLVEARVRRDPIAGAKADHVAGHDVPPQHFDPGAVPSDGRARRHLLAEALRGSLRAMRLHGVERHAYGHHQDDECGIDGVAERRRDGAGGEQDHRERVGEKREDRGDAESVRRGGRLVGSDDAEPTRGLRGRQPFDHASHPGVTGTTPRSCRRLSIVADDAAQGVGEP